MPHNKAGSQPARKPMDKKKLLTIAAVTAAVVVVAVLVDSMIRNPRAKDETDAMNVVIQKVLPSLDEIAPDEGFGLEAREMETIGSDDYYPISITRFPKCEDGDGALRVVESRVLPGLSIEGETELTLQEDQEIDGLKYFVVEVSRTGEGGEKETAATVYVKAKNSQPFVKNEKGELEAAAEQEEIPITTIYVKAKNSQPFVKDDTTGQLVPYGG